MSLPELTERSEKEIALLDAATTLFLAHGYSAATTDMIQRQAAVSKATMYACFPNKEAIFSAVIEDQCVKMALAIRAIEITPTDISTTLNLFGHAYLRILLSDKGMALYRVVVGEAPRFPELARKFYLSGPVTATAMMAKKLKEAANQGEINLQDIGIESAASLFVNLVRAEGHSEQLMHPNAYASEAQIDRWVQSAVIFFVRVFGCPT